MRTEAAVVAPRDPGASALSLVSNPSCRAHRLTALFEALDLRARDVVAVAGAGGKTTLAYRLADEARERGLRVLVTTTTHMGTLPESTTGPLFVEAEGETMAALEEALRRVGRATVLGRRLRADKLEGVSGERVDALAAHADLVIVEADGARGRSLKVPAAHEPVVPSSTTLLLVLAAMDVIGQPLSEERVHRLDLVSQATGLPAGARVDAAAVAAALRHQPGYPGRAPAAARRGVFLNKAEDAGAREAARRIAEALVPPYDFVVAGSARDGEGVRL